MNIIPLHDHILVRRDSAETVSPGGIIIPGTTHDPRLPRGCGRVVALGVGRKDEKNGQRKLFDVKVGDHVYFSKFDGDKVRDDLGQMQADADLVIVAESDILFVREDE